MNSLTCFKKPCIINWFWALLALACVTLFCTLGAWQVGRWSEKKIMVTSNQLQLQTRPQDLLRVLPNPKNYQRVVLEGHFLNETLYLDNQHHNHQLGYDVLMPFVLGDGQTVLVNRGWIAGQGGRTRLPVVDVPEGVITLKGSIYYPSDKQWVLGPDYEKTGENQYIIERLDLKLLNQLLQKSFYPFIIRLDQDSSHGFVRDWPVVSMPPERHLAYAVQWFSFALVTVIIFFALTFKKKHG